LNQTGSDYQDGSSRSIFWKIKRKEMKSYCKDYYPSPKQEVLSRNELQICLIFKEFCHWTNIKTEIFLISILIIIYKTNHDTNVVHFSISMKRYSRYWFYTYFQKQLCYDLLKLYQNKLLRVYILSLCDWNRRHKKPI
jgi:hypothetical protein